MKGKISISRVSSNRENDYVAIEVVDALSGIAFLRAKLDFATFAQVVTGASYLDMEYDVFGLHNVGKVRQIKRERIQRPDWRRRDDPAYLASLLAPFEVDGWVGHVNDLTNGHCACRDGSEDQYVTFHRYVDPEEVEANAV